MKSYLDLIPISARVSRRQNRMSVACILLAVFLVTTIFGMADMYIRAQITQIEQENGRFHIGIVDVTDDETAIIAARSDVAAVSRYGVIPYEEDAPYTLFGRSVMVAGCDSAFVKDIMPDFIAAGDYPQRDDEVMLTQNVHDVYGVAIGDAVTINAPDGRTLTYTVSGFCSDTAQTMSKDGIGAILTTAGYRAAYAQEKGLDATTLENTNLDDVNSALYVQFKHPLLARQAISHLKEDLQLADDQVIENIKLLGLYGQSSSTQMLSIYASALVLGLLVLIAGVLMIASSLGTRVAQRTEFYGMLRCLGATPKQVMRLVRREALRWCRLAIPLGVMLGVVLIWALCAVLRHLAPEYFATMPTFAVSVPAILAGVVLGLATVFLALRTPAKRAAGVSPLAAVSGNTSGQQPVWRACNTRHLRVETALGVHHACASCKNLLLMTASFALSIILFLSFSVAVDFMYHGLKPLQPWTADVSLVAQDNSRTLPSSLLTTLEEDAMVDAAYGRMFAYGLPAQAANITGDVDLVSYDAQQFNWAEDALIEGSLARVQTELNTALAVYHEGDALHVGDTVQFTADGKTQAVEIVGVLSDAPFESEASLGLLICSEETFRSLVGEGGYTVIDLQLAPAASDADVNAIRALAGDGVTFVDDRLSNASVRGSYYCFAIFVYGFLVVIALITVFNIVNSIAMSVAARTRQYGVFRAIGLSNRQLRRMIVAEAATYTILGGFLGTVLGLSCHYLLFKRMITTVWGTNWTLPLTELATILAIMLAAVVLAVHRPLKQLRTQAIVDTITMH